MSEAAPRLLRALREHVLLGDGAMGTQLQQAGLEPGACGEAWTVDHPERILEIQRRYVEAGSDCLLTCTFGASRIMLERHGEGDRVADINAAAVGIAREAFGEREGFVIGDIGPFGGLMEPYGDVPETRVRQAFAEQARALVGAGVDAVIVETQTAMEELAIGLDAAREAGAPVVIGSVAFDRLLDSDDARTMMGVGPEQAAQCMLDHGAHVLGLNCGAGIDMALAARIVRVWRTFGSMPLAAQPNAGQPVLEGTEVVYRQTPEEMAAGLGDLLDAGARLVGGCCGSTPAHVGRLREELDARGHRR